MSSPPAIWFTIFAVARVTDLDKRWDELMGLCQKEAEFQRNSAHPKLSKVVAKAIDELGRELGFTERQIVAREFRAERDGDHIVRVIRE